jgi:hypothetical protein
MHALLASFVKSSAFVRDGDVSLALLHGSKVTKESIFSPVEGGREFGTKCGFVWFSFRIRSHTI